MIKPPQSPAPIGRLVELYRERYGAPEQLAAELGRPAPEQLTSSPVTSAEALENVRRLALAIDGTPPCLTCWRLERRPHVEGRDRTHYFTSIEGAL